MDDVQSSCMLVILGGIDAQKRSMYGEGTRQVYCSPELVVNNGSAEAPLRPRAIMPFVCRLYLYSWPLYASVGRCVLRKLASTHPYRQHDPLKRYSFTQLTLISGVDDLA